MITCPEETVNIFSAGAGKIIALDDDTAVPIAFTVDGSADTFNDLKGIVTSVGIRGQAGFQFMHAMREFIYVYVFTERVGEIVVSGMTFPASCEPLGPQDDADNLCFSGSTGLERVLTWYDCNRITSRAAPIVIAFGSTVSYEAFLVSVKADIANADTGIAQFSLAFNFIPNISDADEFCFDLNEDCIDMPCDPE